MAPLRRLHYPTEHKKDMLGSESGFYAVYNRTGSSEPLLEQVYTEDDFLIRNEKSARLLVENIPRSSIQNK